MILTNYSDHQTPQFQILNYGQRQELYLAALEALNRIGVMVNNPEAHNLLVNAGARADQNTIRIPAHIIQTALTTTPPGFTLWGRTRQHEMHVAPGRTYFGPGPTCTYFMDPWTGERRKARRGDAGLTARVVDALPNIDYCMGLSLFDDVTPVLSPVYEFAESLAATSKPIMAWANTTQTLQDIYKMAVAVAGDEHSLRERPVFGFFATYESPLRHTHDGLANVLWAAEHHIPIAYLGGPTFGLESPFSGASALVIYLATVLSAVAIIQLKQPGAPIAVGGLPSSMDLRTARPAYGSPESGLHTAACAELASYLKLPFMGTAGASESKILDAQAGVEATMQVLLSALSGAGMVHDVGFLDCADIGSLEYLVLVDEIVGLVKRIQRGIVVNRESIMMDLIEQVGPGGTFLTEPRSASLCRTESWVPTLLDRAPYLQWDQKGRLDTAQRAHAKLRKILDTHVPPPLPDGVAENIQVILAEAERREEAR